MCIKTGYRRYKIGSLMQSCPSLMIFASVTQFHVYLQCWVNARLAECLHRFSNVEAVVAAIRRL